MHVLRDHWGTRGISQVDAAALKVAVDREHFQQIETIASRSQSPTSATKSANRVAYCPHIIKTERQALAPRQIDDPMLVYL